MILELVEEIFSSLMRTCLRYFEIRLLFLKSHNPLGIILSKFSFAVGLPRRAHA